MSKKTGIFFLTYDGFYNFTSGIGTQTRTFLEGLCASVSSMTDILGEFEVNLIVPAYDNTVDGYREEHILYSRKLVSRLNGRVFTCTSEFDKVGSKFWTVDNWKQMCISSSDIILKEAEKYDRSIVLTVDSPFLLTPKYIESKNFKNLDIRSVITMYTSTYIHDVEALPDRLAWENKGMISLNEYNTIKLADICEFMTEHFKTYFNVSACAFVPYHSSLHITSFTEDRRAGKEVCALLKEYGIPLNKDIIFAFGRASWVKGFDSLLNAYSLSDCNAHLVLLASEFIENKVEDYLDIIRTKKISCTLLTEFDRDLPSILSQYRRCKIVVCPSIREPFSNIPLEVALWAEKNGPIVLASNIGGFVEQIIDQENGFLFEVDDPVDLAQKIELILGLSNKRHREIRRHAATKVTKERNFSTNFRELVFAISRINKGC